MRAGGKGTRAFRGAVFPSVRRVYEVGEGHCSPVGGGVSTQGIAQVKCPVPYTHATGSPSALPDLRPPISHPPVQHPAAHGVQQPRIRVS